MNHLEDKTKHVASTMTGSVTETEANDASMTETKSVSYYQGSCNRDDR